jgi:hypothetical protein
MNAFFNFYFYHKPPVSLLEDELGPKIFNNLAVELDGQE